MATQRAATLNKDLLTQVDGLMAMRVTAPQDRDAIRDWVRGQGDEDGWSMIAPPLPNLATGEAWWWIPEHKLLKRVQVRPSRTFDSSPTRTRGETSQPPKSFADVDLNTIKDRIAATIERGKETDRRSCAAELPNCSSSSDTATETSPSCGQIHLPSPGRPSIPRF